MKTKTTLVLAALSALVPLTAVTVHADETASEKAESSARSAKNKTKKNWRKTKKHVRDATGNGSMTEDAKDAAKNTGDAIDDTAKTTKDKVD